MACWAGELVTEKPATVAPSQVSARLAVENSRERHAPTTLDSQSRQNPNFSISLEWSGADVSLANVLNPNR